MTHSAENDAVLNDMLGALGKVVEAARAERHDAEEKDAAPVASLREQVEQIERLNQRAGYPVPEGALICLPYTEARALLDYIIPPAGGITPGGNPTCPKCGLWYGPGLPHKCVTPPAKSEETR